MAQSQTKYLKVMHKDLKQRDFQYQTGTVNRLNVPFEVTGTCVRGGLYVTTNEHIHKFYICGEVLAEVYVPTDDPDFRMVIDPSGDKWRTNMLELGECHSLLDPETYTKFGIQIDYTYMVVLALKNNDAALADKIIKDHSLKPDWAFGLNYACYNDDPSLAGQMMSCMVPDQWKVIDKAFLWACVGNSVRCASLMIANGSKNKSLIKIGLNHAKRYYCDKVIKFLQSEKDLNMALSGIALY